MCIVIKVKPDHRCLILIPQLNNEPATYSEHLDLAPSMRVNLAFTSCVLNYVVVLS